MPPKHKTPMQIEKERQIILDAALDVIANQGYEQLTMRAIAKKCDMSATKIYYYFINKEHVYFNIMHRGFSSMLNVIQQAYERGETPKERFRGVAQAIFDFAEAHLNCYNLLFNTNTPRCTEMPLDAPGIKEEQEAAFAFYDFWSKCLRELAESKGRVISTVEIAYIFSQIHGIISLHHSRNLKEVDIEFSEITSLGIEKIVNSFENESN